MSAGGDLSGRRSGDHFGLEYVVERLVKAVDDFGDKIDAMASKAEVGILFAKLEEKADTTMLDKIDARLTRIERNQLPPWTMALFGILATIALAIIEHTWK